MNITHFTKDISTIEKILINGFAWVPNKRNLIQSFISDHDFSAREPQEFGMISFTEIEAEYAVKHRDVFGHIGIVMAEEWVEQVKLQKVIYIDERGPVHEALSELFKIGYQDLKERIRNRDNSTSDMPYTNKAMASIYRAKAWYNLLQLYEYLEPICNSYQQEWRLVQKEPLYGYKNTKEEIIKNISPPEGWANILNVLKFNPKDVKGFVCPCGEKNELFEVLPAGYKSHNIETFKA
jgi:hypothetical protein